MLALFFFPWSIKCVSFIFPLPWFMTCFMSTQTFRLHWQQSMDIARFHTCTANHIPQPLGDRLIKPIPSPNRYFLYYHHMITNYIVFSGFSVGFCIDDNWSICTPSFPGLSPASLYWTLASYFPRFQINFSSTILFSLPLFRVTIQPDSSMLAPYLKAFHTII